MIKVKWWWVVYRPNPQLKVDMTQFYDLALSMVEKPLVGLLGAIVMSDLVVLLSVLVVLVDIVDNY